MADSNHVFMSYEGIDADSERVLVGDTATATDSTSSAASRRALQAKSPPTPIFNVAKLTFDGTANTMYSGSLRQVLSENMTLSLFVKTSLSTGYEPYILSFGRDPCCFDNELILSIGTDGYPIIWDYSLSKGFCIGRSPAGIKLIGGGVVTTGLLWQWQHMDNRLTIR